MTRWIAASLLATAALGLAVPAPAQDARQALLIRNAQVIDGEGGQPFAAAVRIRDGRIAAIGALSPEPGEAEVDAHSLTLAPGFIDTHSHHEYGIEKHLDATQLLAQGVTTIVVGQDGGSVTPVSKLFAEREAAPAAVNIASYSGHGTLRDAVLGQDFKRKATPAEIERMKKLLAEDMKAGALGLSTGLEYDPAIYAAPAEVIELAKVAAGFGGRYISHMRSEDRQVWAALDELIEIGRQAKLPVQVSHAKLAMTDIWGQADRFIAKLDAARTEGIDVSLDIYPYPNWESTLTVLWPERDFQNRATTEFILTHLAPPEGILVSSDDGDPTHVGKTIAQIAQEAGTDPATTAMAMIAAAQAKGGDIGVIGTSMNEGDIARLIAWHGANICSDGGFDSLHPRGAGAFARILRHYVRETKLLSVGEAVAKMTGRSAAHMGLSDRGVIRPGARADLVLFDPATIADHATPQAPEAVATGVDRVWVNGVLAYAAGKATGAHPGQVLRREVSAR